MHPSPRRVASQWLHKQASDIQVHSVDMVSGQEPTSPDEFATSMRVEFTLSGQALARMLGKQMRVLEHTLEKLEPSRAMRLLDKTERPVMQALRPKVQAWLDDYGRDELDVSQANIDLLEFDWESDSYWSAKVDPRKEAIRFTVELSVSGEWAY